MNYQGVRAEFESDLATAYAALSPAVPVYFDNTLNTVSDAETEFIHVNLQFGLRTDIFRAPAFTMLQTLNTTEKANSGIYVRIGAINGPSFGTGSTDQESRIAFTPYFISRIDTTFTAQVIS